MSHPFFVVLPTILACRCHIASTRARANPNHKASKHVPNGTVASRTHQRPNECSSWVGGVHESKLVQGCAENAPCVARARSSMTQRGDTCKLVYSGEGHKRFKRGLNHQTVKFEGPQSLDPGSLSPLSGHPQHSASFEGGCPFPHFRAGVFSKSRASDGTPARHCTCSGSSQTLASSNPQAGRRCSILRPSIRATTMSRCATSSFSSQLRIATLSRLLNLCWLLKSFARW